MNKILQDVKEFHQTFGAPVLDSPQIPSQDRCELRIKLIEEEFNELKQAIKDNDIVSVADAVTDLQYVINGLVLEFGLQNVIDACHEEVHSSNMSKLGEDGKPVLREDGKITKGPNFRPPDLHKIIFK